MDETNYAAWDSTTLNKLVRDLMAEVAALKEERQVLLNEVRRLYIKSDSGYPWKEGQK